MIVWVRPWNEIDESMGDSVFYILLRCIIIMTLLIMPINSKNSLEYICRRVP